MLSGPGRGPKRPSQAGTFVLRRPRHGCAPLILRLIERAAVSDPSPEEGELMFVRVRVHPRTRSCMDSILIGADPDTSSGAPEGLIPLLLSGAAAGDVGRGVSPSGGR